MECLDGAHIGTTVVTAFLLVFYTAGFPLLCMYLLTKAFAPYLLRQRQLHSTTLGRVLSKIGYHRAPTLGKIASLHRAGTLDEKKMRKELAKRLADAHHTDPNDPNSPMVEDEMQKVQELVQAEAAERQQFQVHMALFGYLFRGCKDDRYFFRLFTFPISLGFTLTLIFADSVDHLALQTFILGLLYAANGLLHSIMVPFRAWLDNVIGGGSQVASVVYAIAILSLDKTSSDVPFYMVTLAIIWVIIVVPFVWFILLQRGSKGTDGSKKAVHDFDERDLMKEKATDQEEPQVISPVASSPIQASSPSNKHKTSSMMATLPEHEAEAEDAMNQIEEEYNHELLSVGMSPDVIASPSVGDEVKLHMPPNVPDLPAEEIELSRFHMKYVTEEEDLPDLPPAPEEEDEVKHDDEDAPPVTERSISIRHQRDTEEAHPFDDIDEKADQEDGAHLTKAELLAQVNRQRALARKQEAPAPQPTAPAKKAPRAARIEMMQSDSIAVTPRVDREEYHPPKNRYGRP